LEEGRVFFAKTVKEPNILLSHLTGASQIVAYRKE